MRRVLVAIDGSATGLGALRWAATLTQAVGAELTVATVFDLDVAGLPVSVGNDVRSERERCFVDEWCSSLGESDPPYRTVVLEGHVGQQIMLHAERIGAELIVVGTRGRSGLASAGSVATYLAHHTLTPLVTVPAGAATDLTKTVIVGVDGSGASHRALSWAAGLASAICAKVSIVRAEHHPVEWVPHTDPASHVFQARREVAEWAKDIAERDLEVSSLVSTDRHPVDTLIAASGAERSPLIVIGARGVGGFTGMRLGGVPTHLLHHTTAPAAIVPAG